MKNDGVSASLEVLAFMRASKLKNGFQGGEEAGICQSGGSFLVCIGDFRPCGSCRLCELSESQNEIMEGGRGVLFPTTC